MKQSQHAAIASAMAPEPESTTTYTAPPIENGRILSTELVCDRLGVSRVTLWRMVRKKAFKPPIKISANRVGWPESEVSDWVTERVAERDSAIASKNS